MAEEEKERGSAAGKVEDREEDGQGGCGRVYEREWEKGWGGVRGGVPSPLIRAGSW